ncbi:MAG: DUF2807 domain-containing protein [Bacteroidetes bacterium]|jgi:hypothetical protein|nr:DUF2807 domain-containing protein [Bacteroidota bacterium]
MRKLFRLLLSLILVTGSGYAFAKPHVSVTEDSLIAVTRQVSGFNALQVSGPFDVYIQQGNTESVTYKAPKEVLDRIRTDVEGHTLHIGNKHDNWGTGYNSWWSDKSWWRHHAKIVVNITVKDLNSIKVSGSGGAFFDDGLVTNSLKLTVRGSGSMHGKIDVKELESRISGSGNIRLTGGAGSSTLNVSGSGNFIAGDLVTSSSTVRVSGSGNAKINASDKLVAGVSGSGDVRYTGDAKSVRTSTSGSGSVHKL